MFIQTVNRYSKQIFFALLFLSPIIFVIYNYGNIFKNYSSQKILALSKVQSVCKDCNVIMVSLDTLNGNHLPCYGYFRDTSPNLCDFAEKNVMFSNAYANGSWTLPSHVSVFTGLFSSRHSVIKYNDSLSPDKTLIPEALKNHGYNNLFFIPNNDKTLPVNGVYGRIGDGLYNNNIIKWQESIDMFKKSVRENKKTFMFLHTYDVHAPYDIQGNKPIYPIKSKEILNSTNVFETFSKGFVDYYVAEVRKGIKNNEAWMDEKDIAEKLFKELLDVYPNYPKSVEVLKKIQRTHSALLYDFTYYYNYTRKFNKENPDDVDTLRSLYDQTINIMDSNKIPMLTSLVEDPEFKDNTILVIFADHGEEFMEHGHLSHETIYNSNIRVPIIMHVPGLQNIKISQNVQLVDLFPTLIDMVGIKDKFSIDGKSLVNRLLGVDQSDELIVTDTYDQTAKSLILGPWKLFMGKQGNEYVPYELYNLDNDPDESNNVLFSNGNIKDKILDIYNQSPK